MSPHDEARRRIRLALAALGAASSAVVDARQLLANVEGAGVAEEYRRLLEVVDAIEEQRRALGELARGAGAAIRVRQ